MPYFEFVSEVSDELMRDVENVITDGYRKFGFKGNISAKGIIIALDKLIDEYLSDGNISVEFDSIEDMAVTTGILFGYAVCQKYNWKWAYLGMDKQSATLAIVSPYNFYCNIPLHYANEIFEKSPDSSNEKDRLLALFLKLKTIDKRPQAMIFTPVK